MPYIWSFTKSGFDARRSYNKTFPVEVPAPKFKLSRNSIAVICGREEPFGKKTAFNEYRSKRFATLKTYVGSIVIHGINGTV